MITSTKGNEMNQSQLDKTISKVAKSTGKTKKDITKRLSERDYWTWFLIGQAAK